MLGLFSLFSMRGFHNNQELMKTILLFFFLSTGLASSQTASTAALPEKLKSLQDNYNAAIARANAPITTSYIKELERLKTEYTRAGDLKAAVATDELIRAAQDSLKSGDKKTLKLSDLDDRQFKKWLSSVVITEIDSPNGIQYFFDNDELSTQWGDMRSPRIHKTATIEVGLLVVPFTNTVATIKIHSSLTKADISYSSGAKYQASIAEKKR